jgi:hypothetical protein
LIKEPGVYKLEGVLVSGFSLDVGSFRALNPLKEPVKGFYAVLPLVLRPGLNGDFIIVKDKKDKTGRRLSLAGVRGRTDFRNCAAISAAVDCRGVAAFIGVGPDGTIQMLYREDEPSGDPSFFVAVSHKHTGGIDA